MKESSIRNPTFERITKSQTAAIGRGVPYHSLELPGGRIVEGTIPIERLRARLDSFPIPERLDGRSVLDIGAASGWNSFEMERRGADVVAVDCVEYEELLVAKRILGSRVDYRILDVDELRKPSSGPSTTCCSSGCSTTYGIRCWASKRSARSPKPMAWPASNRS